VRFKPGVFWGGVLAVWAAGSGLGAWAETDAERLAAIQKQMSTLQTVAADFTSVKTVAFLSEPIRTHGRLLFEKPSRVCWEVTAPFKAAVVYDGRAAARYLADARGHWTRQSEGPDPVLAETMRQLQMWLSGQAFASSEAYDIVISNYPPGPERDRELRRFEEFMALLHTRGSALPGGNLRGDHPRGPGRGRQVGRRGPLHRPAVEGQVPRASKDLS